METLVANLTGKTRRERFEGRDYIVAPLTLIVPGVLNGTKGPGLYEEDDIKVSVPAWNYMPLVKNHPDADTARDPKIIEQFGLGFVFNAKWDSKLVAEGWFDVEKTKRVDIRIYNALVKNERIELSTGLGLDRDMEPGVHNGSGKSYDWIGRRYRPDHLAILPDARGACSLNDGCGVNNEEAEGKLQAMFESFLSKLGLKSLITSPNTENQMSKLTDAERKTLVDGIIANCDCGSFKEEDRDTLNKMDDKGLKAIEAGQKAKKSLKETEEEKAKLEKVANAAKEGFKAGNATIAYNAETGKWDTKASEPPKEDPAKNNEAPAFDVTKLPADVQADLAFARNERKKQKQELVDRLTSGLEGDAKTAAEAVYNKMTEAELALIAPAKKDTQANNGANAPSFLGASIGNHGSADAKDKPEPMPSVAWNWDQKKAD